jgi:hypothetical protein
VQAGSRRAPGALTLEPQVAQPFLRPSKPYLNPPLGPSWQTGWPFGVLRQPEKQRPGHLHRAPVAGLMKGLKQKIGLPTTRRGRACGHPHDVPTRPGGREHRIPSAGQNIRDPWGLGQGAYRREIPSDLRTATPAEKPHTFAEIASLTAAMTASVRPRWVRAALCCSARVGTPRLRHKTSRYRPRYIPALFNGSSCRPCTDRRHRTAVPQVLSYGVAVVTLVRQ